MKRLICLLILFASISCFAQDEVIFHNGQVAKGKVSEVTDLYIKFKYEGDGQLPVSGGHALHVEHHYRHEGH